METPNHQEWRSRQRVSGQAVLKSALFAGAIVFFMSGGSPWSTAGTMNAIMGRDLPIGMFSLIVLHILFAVVYSGIIAVVIYRLRLIMALLAGVGTGLCLYVINFGVFHFLSTQMQSPELRAFATHISFSLLASAAYKALSVPHPLRGDETEVEDETHRIIGHGTPFDPEPMPASDR